MQERVAEVKIIEARGRGIRRVIHLYFLDRVFEILWRVGQVNVIEFSKKVQYQARARVVFQGFLQVRNGKLILCTLCK